MSKSSFNPKSNAELRKRLLEVTAGTRFGACLRAALGVNRTSAKEASFGVTASVTSDGYLISDYHNAEGEYHMGAFVGTMDDLCANVIGVLAHLDMTRVNRNEGEMYLRAAIRKWIANDYRDVSERRRFPGLDTQPVKEG